MAVVGVVTLVMLDVVVPAVLAAWLIRANIRGHRSTAHELRFWMLALGPLALAGFFVATGIIGVFGYDGSPVVPATLFGLPGSMAPAIATISLSGVFFDDATWASPGYFWVMPAYLVGIVLWQLVLVAGIRRLEQRGRERAMSRSSIVASTA